MKIPDHFNRFADPYKRCRLCDAWVDGADDQAQGPLTVIPCGHRAGYDDVCPSWGPVDGCTCSPKGHGRTEFATGATR